MLISSFEFGLDGMTKRFVETDLQKRVIVFSRHSIFMDGVVSRLRQDPQSGVIHFIDANNPDYIQKITDVQASVVILDAVDSEESRCCLLCELLTAFPSITIIRLEVDAKDVQVISSSPYKLDNVQDLIDLIWREEM